MTNRIIIILVALTLTGCAGLSPPDAYYNAQGNRATAAGKAAAQPLLRITGGFQCAETAGEQGACTIEVFDPRAHESIARIDRGTTAGDVAIEGLRAVSGIAQWGIGGYVVTRALREVGTKTYNVSNEGDGGLTFNNDTHSTALTSSTIEGAQTISGDTSGDVSGDSSGDHQQIADSYNTTETATTTDNSNKGNTTQAPEVLP